MRIRRILITGASGLLGLNLALEAAKEHIVFGLVNNQQLRTEIFTTIQADLLAPGSAERLIEQTRPDWVIHCAALAKLDACEADPARAQQLNTEVPQKLAQYVARGGARLLHVSTDAVFDGQRGNYSEQDIPNPLNVYARTKLDGEAAVLQANPDALVARVNLYGWSLSGRRSLAEFFFYNLLEGKSVMGFTDLYFCPLLANDLAQLFLKMLDTGLSGLYHVVSSECTSKYSFGVEIARKFGLDADLISPTSVADSGLAATRSPNLTLNTEKIRRALSEPPPKLSTGLDQFYTQFQQGYPQRLRQLGDQAIR